MKHKSAASTKSAADVVFYVNRSVFLQNLQSAFSIALHIDAALLLGRPTGEALSLWTGCAAKHH